MRPLSSLAARLVVGQALVVLAGSASLLVVATTVAPGVFHDHLTAALGRVPAGELDHLDQAFQDALVVALGAAMIVATLAALAISILLAARIAAPIRTLAAAAERVAGGERTVRVSLAGADELRAVSAAFNTMAATLEQSDAQRHAFISDITHELRTPVATIDGYLEGLADGVIIPTPETWQLLQDQTGRMRRLVEDLATLARAEEGRLDLQLQRLSLSELLADATTAAAAAYHAKAVTLTTTTSTPITVDADRDRIGEVLANVLGNALRHTPTGGRVTVSTSEATAAVRIVVADTGDGIPPDEIDRVFDRLYRVDASRSRETGGSGLGLAISRLLVESHNGTIHAEQNTPEGGTRIVIEIPRSHHPDIQAFA